MAITPLIIALLSLIAANCITYFERILHKVGRIQIEKAWQKRPTPYPLLVKHLFAGQTRMGLPLSLHYTRYLLHFIYATTSFLFLSLTLPQKPDQTPYFFSFFLSAAGIALLYFFFDSCTHPSSRSDPEKSAKTGPLVPLIGLLFLLFFPATFPLLKIAWVLSRKRRARANKITRTQAKEKMLELMRQSEINALLEPLDYHLINTTISFQEQVVREIMIPRINIFALSIDQTVHKATEKFISKEYSRIPIYENTIDDIVGILLYKDVMHYYFNSIANGTTSPADTPLEKLIKPVLYCPEMKKISRLLQEFLQKHIHLAIVVDEYGGTKGIVTIEDILEEFFGEISDEHDHIEDKLYAPYPKGGWILDAKMSIADIQKHLGIEIPSSPEYDTIGGYLFYRAGTIPSKGWRTHEDHFDLEVLNSDARKVKKVILTPSISAEAPNAPHP